MQKQQSSQLAAVAANKQHIVSADAIARGFFSGLKRSLLQVHSVREMTDSKQSKQPDLMVFAGLCEPYGLE